ncbi:thiamine-phosphate pyrophosphorylase [Rhizobium sp. Leaf384]|uniref:thiamine phosphate synthase n=1 Tax=unclassified Rhizobium TaxID=2613769 RepID=UPI00071423B4|nr:MULTISPECIES: thiamine phosphate synthase [unclassified Rhizobium]KQR69309.1 thiamine-phosphate pyrophosphorylase [Rhizobium sp. Leaf341]KQS77083.1 thiamine-phosphate pyrophosphorylase [Rhizobium sp. Leaf384]KQS78354.1 thiamine-phosphate pyrophosphorylase [Rhizobium sp. Leaf383]
MTSMTSSGVDNRLNAIVDASLADIAPLPDLARAAARNGATLIQYRDKTASTRVMVERATSIREALAGTGVAFVVNDRVDVALAAGADGVHLGADDMDAETARRLLGGTAIIGLTVKTEADADRAGRAPATYACIGGVFETLSKVNPDPPVGLSGLRTLREAIRRLSPDLPVSAIAGIDLARVPEVIAAGADGVAVISAIFRSGDIGGATRSFRSAVDAGVEAGREARLGAAR